MGNLTKQQMFDMVEYCLDCNDFHADTLKSDPIWVLSRIYDELCREMGKESTRKEKRCFQ